MTVLENMAVADLKEKGYGLNRCVRKSRENAYREMLSGLGLGLEDKLETRSVPFPADSVRYWRF